MGPKRRCGATRFTASPAKCHKIVTARVVPDRDFSLRADAGSVATMIPALPLKLKVQILCGEEIAMGPGKADLLDAIAAHGSISAAARAMDMSYRRAWLLVDAMNRCWRTPLVATAPGRGSGGGARLTPEGHAVLADYRRLIEAVDQAAHGALSRELAGSLRDAPLRKAPG